MIVYTGACILYPFLVCNVVTNFSFKFRNVNVYTMTEVAEVKSLLASLQKTFQCSICLDLLDEPVSTKCNHQFCRECVNQLLSTKTKGKAKVRCPLCNGSVTKRSLNEDPVLTDIVAAVKDVCQAADDDIQDNEGDCILSQRHRRSYAGRAAASISSKKKDSLSRRPANVRFGKSKSKLKDMIWTMMI